MEKNIGKSFRQERGGAGIKLVLVLLVLFIIGHGLINYVPVAYSGATYKDEMLTAVTQGTALPSGNNPLVVVKTRLTRLAAANDIPPDAFIEVKQVSNFMQARVAYSKQIDILPFGLYTYQYNFDYTAAPSGFLAK